MVEKQTDNKVISSKIRSKILKQGENAKGYLQIGLAKGGKRTTKKVHRLVAEMFIPNPNNLPQVNHIDGNKKNNNVENLEWCTNKYNIEEAWKMGLAKGKRGEKHPHSKSVNQYDLNGNFIKKWNCMIDIKNELGYLDSSISLCCRGKYKKAYGYIWKYSKDSK